MIAQGGQAGGWSLYVHEGALSCCYNFFGVDRFFVRASAPLPPGDHEVRFAFDYDGGGLAKGGNVTLYVDGDAVGSVVSTDHMPGRNAFTGAVAWAQIDVGDLDLRRQTLEHRIHLTVAHGTQ